MPQSTPLLSSIAAHPHSRLTAAASSAITSHSRHFGKWSRPVPRKTYEPTSARSKSKAEAAEAVETKFDRLEKRLPRSRSRRSANFDSHDGGTPVLRPNDAEQKEFECKQRLKKLSPKDYCLQVCDEIRECESWDSALSLFERERTRAHTMFSKTHLLLSDRWTHVLLKQLVKTRVTRKQMTESNIQSLTLLLAHVEATIGKSHHAQARIADLAHYYQFIIDTIKVWTVKQKLHQPNSAQRKDANQPIDQATQAIKAQQDLAASVEQREAVKLRAKEIRDEQLLELMRPRRDESHESELQSDPLPDRIGVIKQAKINRKPGNMEEDKV